MKLVVVAGTPGSGKTSVLMHTIRSLKQSGMSPAVVKIDCLWTDDDKRFNRLDVPVRIGLSRDMCPDHFAIYNTEEMLQWAREQDAGVLLNETAGLCLRCAPYPDGCLAVCVIDVTTGPNTPLKVGPLLTTADVVVATKGDIVSQAEREVFRERVNEANPESRIIEANGLSGQGASELAEIISEMPDVGQELSLRHNAPLAICTLCTGEMRLAKKHHMGVLRHIDGFTEYRGEWSRMTQDITGLLPGYNCGECGYQQCRDYGAALLGGEAELASCPHLDLEKFAANIPRIQQVLDASRTATTESQVITGVIDRLVADFMIAPLPSEPSCREDLHPFDPEARPAAGEHVKYRPLGCPVTHFARVLDAKRGIVTVHMVGPLHRLGRDDMAFEDIGICMVTAFDGIVSKGRVPDVGQTVKFLPEHCMMQKVHSGVVVHSEGSRVRIEGIDLKVW